MAPEEKLQDTAAQDEGQENFGDSQDMETQEAATDETTKTEESSNSAAEETTETTDEESKKLEDAVESTEEDSGELEAEEEKSNTQKRIDKLTARNYQLEAELKAEREKNAKKETEATKGERVYTESELNEAEQKAIAENDMSLMSAVNKERLKNQKRELIGMYQKERSQETAAASERKVEWQSIVDVYGDDDPKWDIRNQNSDLYKLAKQYYEDPVLKREYAGKGGMFKAVAHAYRELSKLGKQKTRGEKKLERKLAKTKMKTSLGKGAADKSGSKVTTDKKFPSKAHEEVAEHKAVQRKAMGTEGF